MSDLDIVIRNGTVATAADVVWCAATWAFATGVNEETRADILWHVRKGMPQHYAVAQIREIHGALERITDERHA